MLIQKLMDARAFRRKLTGGDAYLRMGCGSSGTSIVIRDSTKKETFRRGVEGFFCVSGPVIFGAKAQNGKVTLKLTTSMPDGKFHAYGERSKDELLLLGGLLGRLLSGFLSGFLCCHGTSPPFLISKCKGGEKQSQRFFHDARNFFCANARRMLLHIIAPRIANSSKKTAILRAASIFLPSRCAGNSFLRKT